ncbi:hypothetical protein FQN52_002142 [Onygenales sp. PD_12]|nr:hypothetical protein FQN52_002142 [Onygenales sp. PD_12]
MLEALDHLDAIVDDLGPFDGVFGFSQGAAIALSYIHRQQEMGRAAPFKFALCFSSVCPCSSDELYCRQILQRLSAIQWDDANASAADEKSLSPGDHLVKEFICRVAVPALKNNGLLPAFDVKVYKSIGGSDSPRVLHGQLVKAKIRIPTVHISGKRDFAFMRAMSDVAHGLCDERLARKVEHGGGHQPPQKHAEIKSVLRAMEWAISQSEREMVWHL